MQENNPNITPPRWMTDAQREDFNQAALNLKYNEECSRKIEALINQAKAIAKQYHDVDTYEDFCNGIDDTVGDTIDAYKGDE